MARRKLYWQVTERGTKALRVPVSHLGSWISDNYRLLAQFEVVSTVGDARDWINDITERFRDRGRWHNDWIRLQKRFMLVFEELFQAGLIAECDGPDCE